MKRYSVFLVFVILISCSSDKSSKKGHFKQGSKGPVQVSVMTAKATEGTFTIDVQGETEPSDSFNLKTTGPVDIQKVFVEEGQRVNVGDPLISFDQTELRLKLDVARAEIKEAEATLELNENGEEKTSPPQKNNEGEEVEDVKLAPEPPIGEVDKEKSKAMEEAKLERARTEVSLYENALQEDQIGSPIEGLVVKRRVSDGAHMDTTESLIEIARIDPLYFVFSLPVEDVPLLKREGTIPVRFPVLKDLEVRGEILTLGAAVAKENGKVQVKLKLPNEEGNLHVGMAGQVLINTTEKRRLFAIPESALVKEGGRSYLFVVNDDRAKKVSVELAGPATKGEIRVKSGLKEGDSVVIKSPHSLKGNEIVEIK